MSGLVFKTGVAQFGGVTVQPQLISDTFQSTIQVAKIVANGSSVSSLPFQSIDRIHDQLKSPLRPLTEIIKPDSSSDSNAGHLMPIVGRKISQVLPSFSRHISVTRLVDNRLSDKLNKPNPKFSPYEELTGISKIRPEILFVTTFKPIFTELQKQSEANTKKTDLLSAGINEVGEFIDAQVQLQNLKHEAILRLLQDMRKNAAVKNQLEIKESQFRFHIENMNDHANYLYDTLANLDHLKRVFDLKNDQFATDFKQVVFDHFKSLEGIIARDVESRIEPNITFTSLLSQLGFSTANISKFSNSKICLQLISELENLLKGFSNNLLGISPIDQQGDSNSSFINKKRTAGFSFDPSNVSALSFEFLENLRPNDVLSSITETAQVYEKLFGNVHLPNDESHLAFLFQYLSREFNFSRALKDSIFQNYVQEEYGYPISETFSNEKMFDVIFGFVGEKITDRASTFSPNSLATVSQKIIGDVAILPFETDYVQFENSTYTPGSVYLIDKIAELTETGYNTSTILDYGKDLNFHIERLSYISRALNFFPDLNKSRDIVNFNETVAFAPAFFERIVYTFIDRNTGQPNVDSHSVNSCALFARAQHDNHLKALLFLYVFIKTRKPASENSAQTLETIIKQISIRLGIALGIDKRDINSLVTANTSHNSPMTSVARATPTFSVLGNTTSKFSSTNPLKISDVNSTSQLYQPINTTVSTDSIVSELNNSNSFLNQIFSNFSLIFSIFTDGNQALVNHFTRYSHLQDTTLLMIIFEMLLTVVGRYMNKTLVGKFSGKTASTVGREFYSVRSTLANNTVSINTVKSKLNFEYDLVLKIVFSFLYRLKIIQNSIENTTRNLTSTESITKLNDVLAVLGDRKLLSMIMNEQQIFLIKSFVDDVSDKFFTDVTHRNATVDVNVDAETQFRTSDDLLILDDSLTTTNTKQALFSFFSNTKFLSRKGHNIRLLTVGIPSGFGRHLREKVKVEKVSHQSYNHKQTDVIKINVFKVDIEHQDIIFKPQSFLYELSRFIHRNDRGVTFVPFDSPLESILDAIPTRDYSYVSERLQKRDSTFSDSTLFVNEEYDFLTETQKKDIIRNHVSSYFFELYIRLLTGLQLSEYDFLVDKSAIAVSKAVPFIAQQMIDTAMTKVFVSPDKINFERENPVKISISNYQTPQPVQAPPGTKVKFRNDLQLKPAHIDKAVAATQIVSDFTNMKTKYSDDLHEARRLFSPKSFDRVFNLAVDPDDFQIDMLETLKTPAGKDAFNQLVSSGRIVGSSLPTVVYPSPAIARGVYKIKERDKVEGDLIFEKYFVTIETVLETEV